MPSYLEKYGGIFFRSTAKVEVEEGRIVLSRCLGGAVGGDVPTSMAGIYGRRQRTLMF